MVNSQGKITDSNPVPNHVLLNGLTDKAEKNQGIVSCYLKKSICVDMSRVCVRTVHVDRASSLLPPPHVRCCFLIPPALLACVIPPLFSWGPSWLMLVDGVQFQPGKPRETLMGSWFNDHCAVLCPLHGSTSSCNPQVSL